MIDRALIVALMLGVAILASAWSSERAQLAALIFVAINAAAFIWRGGKER